MPATGRKVLLKFSKVLLRNRDKTMDDFTILDYRSERTILLHAAAQQLGLKGQSAHIILCTVQQELKVLNGAGVSLIISPATEPERLYHIWGAFTAKQLGLAKHTLHASSLRRKFCHLKGLPLQHIIEAQPHQWNQFILGHREGQPPLRCTLDGRSIEKRLPKPTRPKSRSQSKLAMWSD